jgi:hypothetical protein
VARCQSAVGQALDPAVFGHIPAERPPVERESRTTVRGGPLRVFMTLDRPRLAALGPLQVHRAAPLAQGRLFLSGERCGATAESAHEMVPASRAGACQMATTAVPNGTRNRDPESTRDSPRRTCRETSTPGAWPRRGEVRFESSGRLGVDRVRREGELQAGLGEGIENGYVDGAGRGEDVRFLVDEVDELDVERRVAEGAEDRVEGGL